MDVLFQPITWPIVLPLAGGLLCLLLPRWFSRLAPGLALLVSAATVVLVWPLLTLAPFTLELGGIFSLRLDKLNSFILFLTSAFGFLITMFSLGYFKKTEQFRVYYAYLLMTLGASLGALLANDLLLLLVFWGFLGFTLYLMISLGGPDASAAAKKSFIIIGASDSILILGIGLLWVLNQSTRMDAGPIALTGGASYVAFLAFAIAAFAKAGAMPFHTWVPDCGEKAPATVTALLPASLDKLLGIYLLTRVATSLFQMNPATNTLLLVVGALTVILAVMMALVQHDLKRLLSYHAVSQVGYMILGIGTGLPIGIAGALFHMVNNVIYKTCLFLVAGSVESRTGTTNLDRLGGLARVMPITFAACLVASLSISGLPPLNGFASKWMIYQGLVEVGKAGGSLWIIWLAVAMLGSALTLASFVKVLHAVFLTKPAGDYQPSSLREAGLSMTIPLSILAGACVLFGVVAFRLPLQLMILPALPMPVVMTGVWWAGPATAMLLAGLGLGALLYFITTVSKLREAETYIGGEILEPGTEITGVDFYHTIQNLQPFKTCYRLAEKKYFDIYDVSTKGIFFFVEAFRRMHTGRLPWYLTWVIGGLVILLFILRG